jgi:hypothetical protein
MAHTKYLLLSVITGVMILWIAFLLWLLIQVILWMSTAGTLPKAQFPDRTRIALAYIERSDSRAHNGQKKIPDLEGNCHCQHHLLG